MERAAVEVILESGAADPANPPIDHHRLAVIGLANFVLPPVDSVFVEQAVAVEGKDVVDDDFDPGGGQLVEVGTRSGIDLRSVEVDDQPDLDPRTGPFAPAPR
ncbi:MAG: hypothetical protein H0V37_03305 [Chloroflexia bacterium]|nr:hypothetical protein [Chloroflexia bacterium]